MGPRLHCDQYTVLWVCALPTEWAAAREMLDEKHDTPLFNHSRSRLSHKFYERVYEHKTPNPLSDAFQREVLEDDEFAYGRVSEHNVVIVCQSRNRRGRYSATEVREHVECTFTSLRFGLEVGIGGGVPSKEADIRLGDVVVGSPYRTRGGVMKRNSFNGNGYTRSFHSPPPVLLRAVAKLETEYYKRGRTLDEYLSQLGSRVATLRENAGPDTLYAATYDHKGSFSCHECDPSYLVGRESRSGEFGVVVHYGTIALRDQIIKTAMERDELSLKLGGVLCFRTRIAEPINSIACLDVCGICDYTDSHKYTQWQEYAAVTAAAYAKGLLSMIPRAETAKTTTVHEAMREVSNYDTIAQKGMSSRRSFVKKVPILRQQCRNVKELVNVITIDDRLGFDSITWGWILPAISGSDVRNDVVLVCTSSNTEAAGDFAHVHASTFWEYLKQFKWGDFIIEILETIKLLTRIGVYLADGGFSLYAMTDPPVWITCSYSKLSINFGDKETCEAILDLVEVLDWLCKSTHRPTNKDGYVVSWASYSLGPDAIEEGPVHGPSGSSANNPLKLQPYVSLKTSHLPEIKHNCWLSFFDSCVIVDSHITPHDGFGKGLEISFDLMTTLAAADFCLKINSSLVFLGYRTLLYPVAIDGNCAQFHLITTAQGQINPYTLDLKDILPVEDSSQFKTMRCFVGWCEDAYINLGTRHLAADVKYTGGRDHPKSLESDGYALLSQFGASAPLSVIAGVQKNFKYSHHRIRFTPTENYLALLQDASQQPVVLYNSKQRRCWLVPKLSLLLHMSQRYTLGSAAGLIPYAEPHMDAQDLIPILGPAGQINVLAGQDNPLQLQQLLFALNIRMLSTADAMRESGRGKLYGFEFQDIVRSPDQGSCMKELKILSKRKGWLELVNAVGTVIVCSELGEVISVEGSSTRKCEKCNKVPENEDYFTATIPCLSRLAEQKGVELRIGSDGIKFSDKAFWKLEVDPFIRCTHADNSNKTCWEVSGLIQQVVREGILDWKPSLRTSKQHPVQLQPAQSPLVKGAVVFG